MPCRYVQPCVQKPESVMVWCAINGKGQLTLKRCPTRMKAKDYTSILASALSFIKPRFTNVLLKHILLFRRSGCQFQQDGASCHTARHTTSWLHTNNIRRFNGGIWPPSSPDMNIIEHLWPMVGRVLMGKVFTSKDHLWAALQDAFKSISPDAVKKLYDSLPRRLAALHQARGGYTRY